ncbi:MAG TPA: HupE/UreJ family protein [Bryobacteraceae bacterium]|jgi:hypothetical protein
MRKQIRGLVCAALLIAPSTFAHQQPTTLMALGIDSDRVTMNLHIPLPELELAFGHHVTVRPEETIATWESPLRSYLVNHIRPRTTDNQPWQVHVLDMNLEKSEQTQSGPFQEVTIHLSLTPPAGASLRDFILDYDVVMHQVVTHKALVSIQRDWGSGQLEPTQIGVIAVNTTTTRIDPFVVKLGDASPWTGFKSMIALGTQHIREGTDHLLFLLVLLLPATLKIRNGKWAEFGGSHYSLLRLAKIVTAFTLGHSATLLAGSLHWLQLPQQPVEVMIAFSILVTAIHAIRPIFPGREARVAAGFGLVHGLAFATVLADLNLSAGPMALSILGFNLGIEFMQLFVIALTVPWLILLSMTPAHTWVRVIGASLAGVAALGWIVSRVSGQSNPIDRVMESVTQYSPLGIVVLAMIAIPAYIYTTLSRQLFVPQPTPICARENQ